MYRSPLAERDATARLRPHLALIDRFRIQMRSPLAPRLLRLALNLAEGEPAAVNRSQGVPAQPRSTRGNTGVTLAVAPARSILESAPSLHAFLPRHRQTPIYPTPARKAPGLAPVGMRKPPTLQGTRAAVPAPSCRLVAKFPALFKSWLRTLTGVPGRSMRTAAGAARQSLVARLRPLRVLPFPLLRTTQIQATPALPGVRKVQSDAHGSVAPETHRRRSVAPVSATGFLALPVPSQASSSYGRTSSSSIRKGFATLVQAGSLAPLAAWHARSLYASSNLTFARRRSSQPPVQQQTEIHNHKRTTWPQVSALATPAAPRAVGLYAAASSVTSLPPVAAASNDVQASPVPVPAAEGSFDSTRVARWLARALAAEAARPPAAGTGFDPRRTPAWNPSFYAKGS